MSINNEFFTVAEAAEYTHLSLQAIYVAIRKRRLKATRKGRNWVISKEDLNDYRLNKYSREGRKINGELVFDLEKGEFSTNQLCILLSTFLKRPYDMQRLYYLLRTGQLKAFRKGAAWVILKEDAVELCKKECRTQFNQIETFLKVAK